MRPTILLVILSLFLGCRSKSPSPSATEPAESEPTASTPPAPPAPPPRLGPTRPRGETSATTHTIRAGARRLEAFRRERYSVRFDADRNLRLERVDRALGSDRLASVVGPFAQKKRGGSASEVANAGQIVALALARQLGALGWSALVEVGETAAESDSSGDKGEGGQDKEKTSGRPILTRLSFTGEVTFWAEQTGATATATLDGMISVRDASAVEILRSQVRARGEVGPSDEPSAVRRVERAEEAALAHFVRRFLTDRRLEDALVKAIRAARARR